MSRKSQRARSKPKSTSSSAAQPKKTARGWRRPAILIAIPLASVAVAGWVALAHRLASKSQPEAPYFPRPKGELTFSKDIAPIMFKNCSWCHRPGQPGPFNLLTYADARKHAADIAQVTSKRYMPPWPPERGYGEFADERRLNANEIGMLQQWVAEGAIEGNAAVMPALPRWSGDWQLGRPDLVVQAPPYTLPPDGKDVYHHFVVPIPTTARRFVRGVEFLPGNGKVVHHSFIEIDRSRRARRLAERQNPPGFDGMAAPETVEMPGGQLLGWQPGKVPSLAPPGLAWVLETNTDLVLQVHMNPSGKPELVQPSVGFYFTDDPPTNSAYRLRMAVLNLDIPPGAQDYVAEESYVLPVDASLIRVSAHAHYLGKDLQSYAILPDGKKQWLLRIKDWDFNRQGDYRYAKPVELPKGARLVLHYIYDNSTNNVHNPNQPPKRVRFGLTTVDEMAELSFQVLLRDQPSYVTLARDFSGYFLRVSTNYFTFRLQNDPNDAEAHKRLGRALGEEGQASDGIAHLMRAIQLDPGGAEAHYDLGRLLLISGRYADAYREFLQDIHLDPKDFEALGSLGIICLQAQHPAEAEKWFNAALMANPDDTLAQRYLQMIQAHSR